MLTDKQRDFLINNDPCESCKVKVCTNPCEDKKVWWEMLNNEATKYWNKKGE